MTYSSKQTQITNHKNISLNQRNKTTFNPIMPNCQSSLMDKIVNQWIEIWSQKEKRRFCTQSSIHINGWCGLGSIGLRLRVIKVVLSDIKGKHKGNKPQEWAIKGHESTTTNEACLSCGTLLGWNGMDFVLQVILLLDCWP